MPRRHFIRKLMPSYTALYRSQSGDTIVVRTLSPPPEKRKFRSVGGVRTYTKVKERYHLQEVIIVAKSAKTKTKKSAEVTDTELDELEGIEELDDLEDELEDEVGDEEEPDDEEEDEDEDEDEDDEDDDEEEEEVPASKNGRGKKASKPRQSRAAADGLVGTQEVAEFCGVSSRELRMVLRKLREKDTAFQPDSETGRYQWKSLKDPRVKKIKKAIDSGLHKKIRDESLNRLKEQNAAKKAEKENDARAKTKKSSGKKNKKKRVVEEDDE
jgi:hypothetical protein